MRQLLVLVLVLAACAAGSRPQRYAAAPPSVLGGYPGQSYRDTGGEQVALAAEAVGTSGADYAEAEVDVAQTMVDDKGPPPPPPAVKERRADRKVVVEAWLVVEVESVTQSAEAIRVRVKELGGRLEEDNVAGESLRYYGTLKVRIAPELVEPFLAWVGGRGEVTSRRISGTDVTKQFFDSEIALRNLEVTRDRLEGLLKREGIGMQEILQIERELERIRARIEEIKGQLRWLSDLVAESTVTITLSTEHEVVFAPTAKLRPGPRGSVLYRFDQPRGEETRFGGGVTIHINRLATFDLDIFPAADGQSRALLTTFGGGVYSDFFGHGGRAFLNPYIGYRMGYGYVDGSSRFVIAGEIGLELYKQRYVLIGAYGRGMGLLGDSSEAAVQGGLELLLPF